MYKLKEHVTSEMLLSVGFRITLDYEIKAIRPNQNGSNIFIKNNNHVVTWNKDYIQDLIEKGWVEEV